jgi:HEAT repeat protein
MTEEFQVSLHEIVARLAPEHRSTGQRDIDALVLAGAGSTDDLIRILLNPRLEPDLREASCWALSRLGGDPVPQALLEVLRDRNPGLRSAAARALGEVNADAAAPPLIGLLLEDTAIEVRVSAAYALGLLGDPQAIEPLIQKLDDQTEDARVRGTAAEALGDLRDPAGVMPLIAALNDPSAEVRFWAAFAVGQLGDPRALPQLERLAASDQAVLAGYGAVSAEAAEAIRNIRARLNDQ